MKILSIETSCDETAISIVEFKKNNEFTILGNALYSQVDLHQKYGGVFPTVAKREHEKKLPILTREVLKESGLLNISEKRTVEFEEFDRYTEMKKGFDECISNTEKPEIDAISVTNGPGLAPSLWVGVSWAKILSKFWGLPIIPVNHMEGHISASLIAKNRLIEPKYPLISLLVSGGHTELILTEKKGKHKKLGATRDDAVGEGFDKVARLLSLPYPGGPHISKLAETARKENIDLFKFPRPMIKDETFDFSFSGLKTAVRYKVEDIELNDRNIKGVAREFEEAAIEVLISKTKKAIEEYSPNSVLIGGGVSANKHLRKSMKELIDSYQGIDLYLPSMEFSTDNAFMIAVASYLNNKTEETDMLKADANMSL